MKFSAAVSAPLMLMLLYSIAPARGLTCPSGIVASWADNITAGGYDWLTRPSVQYQLRLNSSMRASDVEPEEVKVQLVVGYLREVEQITGTLSLNVFFRREWYDYRLAFNNTPIDGCDDQIDYPMDENLHTEETLHKFVFWRPDLFLRNGELTPAKESPGFTRVYSNGRILVSTKTEILVNCRFSLEKFPFDETSCSLEMGTYRGNKDTIVLSFRAGASAAMLLDSKSNQYKVENGHGTLHSDEWVLTTQDGEETEPIYISGSESRVFFNFTLQRRAYFYITYIVRPMILVALLAYLSFFINPGNERISFLITLLLTNYSFAIFAMSFVPVLPHSVWLIDLITAGTLLSWIAMVESVLAAYFQGNLRTWWPFKASLWRMCRAADDEEEDQQYPRKRKDLKRESRSVSSQGMERGKNTGALERGKNTGVGVDQSDGSHSFQRDRRKRLKAKSIARRLKRTFVRRRWYDADFYTMLDTCFKIAFPIIMMAYLGVKFKEVDKLAELGMDIVLYIFVIIFLICLPTAGLWQLHSNANIRHARDNQVEFVGDPDAYDVREGGAGLSEYDESGNPLEESKWPASRSELRQRRGRAAVEMTPVREEQFRASRAPDERSVGDGQQVQVDQKGEGVPFEL